MDRNSLMSPVLYWLGFMLLIVGIVVNTLWRGIAPGPTLFLGALLLASLILAFMLSRFLRCRLATASLLLWLLALAYFTGFAPFFAVILVALAAMGVGSLLVPVEVPARGPFCVLVGIALLCGIDGWLLPFHIHFHAVYVITLAMIVLLRWRSILAILRAMPERWCAAVAAAPGTAVLSMLAVGAMSTFAWLPTLNFDSLTYHLNLPSQLFTLGYYQMDAATIVWAISPWLADVLQAIAGMTGGVLARGAVDALWASLALVLIWKLCEELKLHPSLRWLAAALYASIPTIAFTLSTMQTEGPTAAVIAALALLIQHVRAPSRRDLVLAATLFALLMALKISNLMFAGPLGLWLLVRWRGRLPWRALPHALLIVLLVAGSSYVYAWKLTGNPVLPMFNGIFHSPYFAPKNYHDYRWDSGFHWNIIWRLVFHSGDYMQVGGAAPILVLIALAGSWLVVLARPVSRPLALVAVSCLLLPFYEIQYFRYAEPSLALLIPAMLCGVPLTDSRSRQTQCILAALGVLVVLSLSYVSGISWQSQEGVLQQRVVGTQASVVDAFASSRRMVQVINDRYGVTGRVLILDRNALYSAELAGRGFALYWHDPELKHWAGNADSDPTGQVWTRVFERTGVNLVQTTAGNISPALMAAITKANGRVVFEDGDWLLWQLDTGKDGVVTASPPYGVSVTFDTTTAPPAQTLVDASVTLRCNPDLARKGHIVAHWTINQKSLPTYVKYSWAVCLQDGKAQMSTHMALAHRVTEVAFQAVPEPAQDMGLAVLESHASLRRDLTAERDLSQQARHVLEFKKSKRPVGPVEP